MFYSTGIRRAELAHLAVFDLDVRKNAGGDVLETTHIVNDPVTLAEVVTRAGDGPEVVLETAPTGPATQEQRRAPASHQDQRFVQGRGSPSTSLCWTAHQPVGVDELVEAVYPIARQDDKALDATDQHRTALRHESPEPAYCRP